MDLIFALLASAGYAFISIWMLSLVKKGSQPDKKLLFTIGLLACCMHGLQLMPKLFLAEGINLGFFIILSLVAWFISTMAIFTSLYQPVSSMLPMLFPISLVSLWLGHFDQQDLVKHYPTPVIIHILLSILAYSVLSIAAVQAIIMAIQERFLRAGHFRGFLQVLPPLITMEVLLFSLIQFGTLLLTAALATGLLFFENFFAQHLAHKTFFSIIAWLIFCVLIWGHSKLGWRGTTAIKSTLIGFTFLMLAFFGTKLVLELVLNKV